MNKSDSDKLVHYYQSELAYLRNSGMEFAKRYPKIAEKLDISESVSADPHVERMLESFAFMTGKLQKQIDDQFPEIAHALLSVLYEPLTLPTPSITLVHFDADMKLSAKSPGITVKKNTQIYAKAPTVCCTFRICHDVTIWPLEIIASSIEARDNIEIQNLQSAFYLKLVFKWYGNAGDPCPSKIRIYITGDNKLKNEIFSSLFMSNGSVFILSENETTQAARISGVGITDDESIFSYNDSVFKGFRLLQEYFAFPDKFYGFQIDLPQQFQICNTFEIVVPLEKYISLPKAANIFLLHAVPAVNLFDKTTDPLRLSHQSLCYRLVADSYRNSSTEIMYIKKMMCIDQNSNKECEAPHFFSRTNRNAQDISWYVKRKKSCIAGEDIDVYFVDQNFNPLYPANKIFYAQTVCTNRHMAELIPAFALFSIEQALPVKQIYCVYRPTAQTDAICDGESIWQLISILSLNACSFSNPITFKEKLEKILQIFSCNRASSEIYTITDVSVRKDTKLYKSETWKGFIRGTSIKLTFDNDYGVLLSYILSNFFSVYTSINTFTELTVINDMGEKTWDMHVGLHNYL